MVTTTAGQVAQLLARQRDGDASARDELFALLYDDLRRVAASALRSERRDHTAVPTALVHEVYLRLVDVPLTARDRRSFLALAGLAMRRALVDSARRRRLRRDARTSDPAGQAAADDFDPLRLEVALDKLERLDPELSELVHLRFLAGASVEEVAELLGVSAPTVKRRWRVARAWLKLELEGNA